MAFLIPHRPDGRKLSSLILAGSLILLSFFPKVSHCAQFQIPTFRIAAQGSKPAMTEDGQGGCYLVWQNFTDAVHIQHYDASGQLILADTTSIEDSKACVTPRIAANSSMVVTVWDNYISTFMTFFKTYLECGLFTRENAASHTFYLLNNKPQGGIDRHNPDIVFLNDTTYIGVWSANDDLRYQIYGTIMTTTGRKLTDNVLMSDHSSTGIDTYRPRLVYKKGSSVFYLFWTDNSSGTANLYGRKFDLAGTPQGASFLVSDDPQMTYVYYYSVAADTAGNFCAVWTADKGKQGQIEWRWYAKDGTPSTAVQAVTPLDTVVVSGNCVEISIDEKNRAVMVWEQLKSSMKIGKTRIFLRCYSADSRQALGEAIQISSDTLGRFDIYPCITATQGRIFTAWQNDTSSIHGAFFDIDKVTSVEKEENPNSTVSSFTLAQNYPNPFNPSTTISFSIPMKAHVSLKIFDVMGREVATIISDELSAGTYQRQWNASGVPSGMYFYRLQAGSYAETKRLVVVK